MGREITLFSSKQTMPRGELAVFLRQLADRIESGHVNLRSGDSEQQLNIPDTIILEMKVEDEEKRQKGTQHSLEVEVKWFDDMPAATGGVELI